LPCSLEPGGCAPEFRATLNAGDEAWHGARDGQGPGCGIGGVPR
jgi:hypothetical protein